MTEPAKLFFQRWMGGAVDGEGKSSLGGLTAPISSTDGFGLVQGSWNAPRVVSCLRAS